MYPKMAPAAAADGELLTATNYGSWKSYMERKVREYYLGDHLCMDALIDGRIDLSKDKKVLKGIQMSCSPEMLPHISYAEFAAEAWGWLEEAAAAPLEEKVKYKTEVETAATSRATANKVPEVDKVLTRRNFGKWKQYMKNLLLSKYLWNVVDGREPIGSLAYKMKNHNALVTIRMSCGEEMLDHIYEEDHAHKAWRKLAEGATNCSIKGMKGIDSGETAELQSPLDSNKILIGHEPLSISTNTKIRSAYGDGDDELHLHILSNNYKSWEICMRTYLKNQGLWGFMEESVISDHVKDEEALDAIKLSCGPEMLGYILYMDCAKHAWDKLAQVGAFSIKDEAFSHGYHCFIVEKAEEYRAGLSRFSEADKVLTRNNFKEWKEYMIQLLTSQMLVTITNTYRLPSDETIMMQFDTESPSYVASNACAIRIMKEACAPDMLPYIFRTKSAEEVWKLLTEACKMEQKDEYMRYSRLLHAVQKNDFHEQMYDRNNEHWRGARNFFRHFPEALTDEITEDGSTALHVAIRLGRVDFVKELLNLMTPKQLNAKTHQGTTAIEIAAGGNNMEIIQMMAKMNPALLENREHGYHPLTIAAINGNEIMLRYLHAVTPIGKDWGHIGNAVEGNIGTSVGTLITSTARLDAFDIVLHILRVLSRSAFDKDAYGMTLLTVLARKPFAFPSGSKFGFFGRCIYQLAGNKTHGTASKVLRALGGKQPLDSKAKHIQSLAILEKLCSRLPNLNPVQLKEKLIFDAIQLSTIHGIIEIFENLIDTNPYLEQHRDEYGRGLFQIAIMFRQENIFQYLCDMGQRNHGMNLLDNFGNNALHCAGFWDPLPQLNKVQGPALQMQRELHWLQEVERVVPPRFKEMKNNDNLTPGALFSLHHKDLADKGEKWMKDTAQACMLVTTLIATVMFAAAFTLPGGSDQNTGLPLTASTTAFKIFIISDAISLFAACTSVLMFFSLLTARYAERDFLTSLPRKLILGLLTLFISIATMMATFAATLVIVLRQQASWVFIPVSILAAIPVVLFGLSQFPLFVDIVSSTYGRGIFRSRSKKASLSKPVYSGGYHNVEVLEV